MLSHVSIGVKDLARSRRFYDAALEPLGYRCLHESDGALGYGGVEPRLWLLAVERPAASDGAPGLHLCFDAARRADVAGFHAAALTAGGKDNGKPGLRADYGENYYAAFVIDPDGYRLEAYSASPK